MSAENQMVRQRKNEVAFEKFESVANELNGLATTLECQPATRIFRLADAMNKLDAVLTPEVLAPIQNLMGSRVGFKTDKDRSRDGSKGPGYPIGIIKEVVKEAILYGAHMTGNEVNIIAGGMYATKEYFMRRVRELPGLSDLEVMFSTPVVDGDKAKVRCAAKWKQNGVERSIGHDEKTPCTFLVKVYDGQGGGADQAVGKAARRLYKRIYEMATGSTIIIPDGEAEYEAREAGARVVETDAKSESERLKEKMRARAQPAEQSAPPNDEFKDAYSKLNLLYNDHAGEIEKALFALKARSLPEMQDTTDAKEIAAIIKVAAEFKPVDEP